MTVEECANKLSTLIVLWLIAERNDRGPTGAEVEAGVANEVRLLVYSESERAAGVLTARCDQIKKRCWDGDNIARQDELKTCHDEILATSPGKGGSSD